MNLKTLGFLVCLVFLQSTAVFGQATGSIIGRVVDPSGAVIAGAAVTATNTGTNQSHSNMSNSDGLYRIPALEPGVYDVKVDVNGFASILRKGITLLTDTELQLNFQLAVASTNQQVQVQGEAVMVETTQAGIDETLQTSEVQNLPVLNRNFQGLVSLLPGVKPAPLDNPTKAAMGASISFGGGNGRNLNTLIDGAGNKDYAFGGPLMNYTLEGVEEFRLLAHDFGPQYGLTSGGVLEITTKSGTNSIHGSAFGFGRNDAMTATDYFAKAGNLPKTAYARENLGGSMGAPIKKDRWFIFGAFEHTTQDYNQTEVPAAYQQELYLVPYGAVPSPTLPQPFHEIMYTIKSDLKISEHHSLFVRWAQQRNSLEDSYNSTTKPDIKYALWDYNRLWSITAGETWIIGTNSVNQFLFQRNSYYLDSSVPGDDAPGGSYQFNRPVWANLTFPAVSMGPMGSQNDYQKEWEFTDNFSHQMGKHALKFGGDFGYFPKILSTTDIGYTASMTFFDNPSVIVNNTNGKYPLGFLTPGIVSNITQGTNSAGGLAIVAPTTNAKQIGYYFADEWKVTPRLTLNLGIRYDVDLGWNHSQSENKNNREYQILSALSGVSPLASRYAVLPHDSTRDYAPRVGFAWDIGGNGKNVLRGGFGIFFEEPFAIDNIVVGRQSQANIGVANSVVDSAIGAGPDANYVFQVSPLPPSPPAASTQFPTGQQTAGYWYAPGITNPYNEQTHIGYEHAFTGNTVLSADYTHVLGLREFRTYNIDSVDTQLWDPSAPACADGAPGTSALPACTRILSAATNTIFGDPKLLGQINIIASNNRSQYNELNVRFEHRTGRFTYQASYVLSYAYSFGGTVDSSAFGTFSGPAPAIPNQEFAPGEWGPSALDERHHVVLSGVANIWRGIQVSPVFTIASPRPYTLTAGSDCFDDSQGGERLFVNPATNQPYYNSAGVYQPCPMNTVPGSTPVMVGVNSQRGIWSYDLDARVTKEFKLGETKKIAAFAEFYNLTNKANFGNQFNGAGNAGASFEQPSGYLLGMPTSRQLQLGARFTF